MEFVIFVLCTAVIVQTSAAPLEASYPHNNNQFDVPEIARNGFEMKLEASIEKEFKEKFEGQTSWKVILEADDESEFCADENVTGIHICIKQDKAAKAVRSTKTSTFKLRIVGEKINEEQVSLQVYLNESYQLQKYTTFEKLKHVSMGGVIGEIEKLHFNFSKKA